MNLYVLFISENLLHPKFTVTRQYLNFIEPEYEHQGSNCTELVLIEPTGLLEQKIELQTPEQPRSGPNRRVRRQYHRAINIHRLSILKCRESKKCCSFYSTCLRMK